MNRYKSFEATGVAPNGRLYAGDLNAIQDLAAAQADFSQVIDLQAIRIGETDVQLLHYGDDEVRLSSAFRIDSIFRGLGGLVAGAFTNAQRDAIPVGFAPKGLVIYNTTVNEQQINTGTDAARVWQRVMIEPVGASGGSRQVGEIMWWLGNPTLTGFQEPIPGWILMNGVAISRSQYAALYAMCQTTWGIGDGSTTFNIPNCTNGRIPVPQGANFTRGANGGEITHVLTVGELAQHAHGISSDGDHTHNWNLPVQVWDQVTLTNPVTGGGGTTMRQISNGVQFSAGSHSHGGGTGNQGSNNPHNNMSPYTAIGALLVRY